MPADAVLANLPDGYYAIDDPNHPIHISTWRKSTKNGKPHLEPDRDTRWRNQHTDAWKRHAYDAILENPEQARHRYAKVHIRCYWCGRKLTDPESQAAGVGPICRSDR